jgi:hypothetical protein
VSDGKENLLVLPVRQALGSANAGDGRRDCDDRIGNTAARPTAVAVAACTACRRLKPARTRRSMKRRRLTLPLNVVADCGLTVA